jgi:glutamate 5-kinase
MGSAGLMIVKVGSGVVAPAGRLDRERLVRLAMDITGAVRASWRVAVVSSGAVVAGMPALGLREMPRTIVGKQASAAVGQSRLMQAWAAAFEPMGLGVGQVLLTAEDLDHRGRFLNARRTLEALLEAGIVPIINENDSVAHEEIRFGDNDRLSALVASLLDADRLLLLSVVPGLQDAEGRVVAEVTDPAAALAMVRSERSATGVGGMASKLTSAALAAGAGVEVTIAPGAADGVVARVASGERVGTRFPATPGAPAKKRWIGHAARPRGAVVVDDGARAAILTGGASLLPAGVRSVEGGFEAGDVVDIRDAAGAVIARGLASYGAGEVGRIAGRRSSEIASVLGYVYAEEVVHREDMHVIGAPR